MSKKKVVKVVKAKEGPKMKARAKPTTIAALSGAKKKNGIVSKVGKALS